MLLIGALAAVLGDPGVSGASVIAESGAIQFESPPPVVSATTGQSNTAINFFTERTDAVLPTTTPIDITPGTSFPTNYYGNTNLTPGTLAAGTAVDSYFMYSNPVGQPSNTYTYTATLTLSAPILGVIVTPNTLTETNANLGAPGTTYGTSAVGDGLETTDRVELVRASTIYLEPDRQHRYRLPPDHYGGDAGHKSGRTNHKSWRDEWQWLRRGLHRNRV